MGIIKGVQLEFAIQNAPRAGVGLLPLRFLNFYVPYDLTLSTALPCCEGGITVSGTVGADGDVKEYILCITFETSQSAQIFHLSQ